jgi:DNA mismatch endonuclease (patch repair protein)
MSDVLTPEQRRRNMSAIKGKDTKPEMIVRRMAHEMGYRYRLHRKDLPGKPDLVFPGRCKVIEIRGCYWHMHECKYGRVIPKTNTEFWQTKRQSNVTRDTKNAAELEKLGWNMLVIWECETRDSDRDKLRQRLKDFLEN